MTKLEDDADYIEVKQLDGERRVFYVDIGNLPVDKAASLIDDFKIKVQGARLPENNTDQ